MNYLLTKERRAEMKRHVRSMLQILEDDNFKVEFPVDFFVTFRDYGPYMGRVLKGRIKVAMEKLGYKYTKHSGWLSIYPL